MYLGTSYTTAGGGLQVLKRYVRVHAQKNKVVKVIPSKRRISVHASIKRNIPVLCNSHLIPEVLGGIISCSYTLHRYGVSIN